MTILSKRTQSILRNFSNINNSIVIKPGSSLRTLSVNKNILAVAKVPETFEQQISIYDLASFIGGLDLFVNGAELRPESNYVQIVDANDARRQTRFYYADPDIIVQPPDKNLDLPSVDVTFDIAGADFENLIKAARLYRVPDCCVFGADGKVTMCVTDKKNETSNTFAVEVGTTDKDFCHCFKVENLNLLISDYTVEISSSKVAKFTASDLEYWIALEP